MRIILYVGLPKTATTFYQLHLFPKLDRNRVVYNPKRLMKKVGGLLMKESEPEERELKKINEDVRELNRANPGKILLIVNEHMCYRAWSPDPENGVMRTKKIFPDAEIILTLRYQPDWLLSLYRHYMDVGGCLKITEFLNYKNNFQTGRSDFDFTDGKHAIVSIDIYKADWTFLLNKFVDAYGKNNIHLLFFENFIRNKEEYTQELCRIIGDIGEMPPIDYEIRSNKGRSSLACKVIYIQAKMMQSLGVSPRSIRQWNTIVSDYKSRSPKGFVKKIIHYMSGVKIVLLYAPFQYFAAKLDQMLFYDNDLLHVNGLREELDKIYHNKNIELSKTDMVDMVPNIYIGK